MDQRSLRVSRRSCGRDWKRDEADQEPDATSSIVAVSEHFSSLTCHPDHTISEENIVSNC